MGSMSFNQITDPRSLRSTDTQSFLTKQLELSRIHSRASQALGKPGWQHTPERGRGRGRSIKEEKERERKGHRRKWKHFQVLKCSSSRELSGSERPICTGWFFGWFCLLLSTSQQPSQLPTPSAALERLCLFSDTFLSFLSPKGLEVSSGCIQLSSLALTVCLSW